MSHIYQLHLPWSKEDLPGVSTLPRALLSKNHDNDIHACNNILAKGQNPVVKASK